MEYLDVAQARERSGLRLVLSIGVPGPWGEAAKNILHVKAIPYVPVAQYPGMPNDELVAWTGRNNAPIAILDDEDPRSSWSEILFLAERLSPEPRLIPEEAGERALMFGLSHEICGEHGLGWSRRLMMVDDLLSQAHEGTRRIGETLGERYGFSKMAAEAAPARAAAILQMLSTQLRCQKEAGRNFLVGASLSAADLYWAAFAIMFEPMPPELCPLPETLRGFYRTTNRAIAEALDPALLAHRDWIYRNYLPLPMSF
jgi:glutathione S-transferase